MRGDICCEVELNRKKEIDGDAGNRECGNSAMCQSRTEEERNERNASNFLIWTIEKDKKRKKRCQRIVPKGDRMPFSLSLSLIYFLVFVLHSRHRLNMCCSTSRRAIRATSGIKKTTTTPSKNEKKSLPPIPMSLVVRITLIILVPRCFFYLTVSRESARHSSANERIMARLIFSSTTLACSPKINIRSEGEERSWASVEFHLLAILVFSRVYRRQGEKEKHPNSVREIINISIIGMICSSFRWFTWLGVICRGFLTRLRDCSDGNSIISHDCRLINVCRRQSEARYHNRANRRLGQDLSLLSSSKQIA